MVEQTQSPKDHSPEFIDTKHAWDLHFWCDELSLKAEELREIVGLVGPAVHDVRVHIAKKLLNRWQFIY